MEYKCIKAFNRKFIDSSEVAEVSVGDTLTRDKDYLLYHNKPVCTWRSQIAKDYLVWNGDGEWENRFKYEKVILFDERERSWEKEIEVTDPETHEKTTKVVTIKGRFLPSEAKYMVEHYPQFFESDGRFNDYFYTGSHITDIKDLANYLENN